MADEKNERFREEFGMEREPSSDEKAAKRANAVILCVVCCTAVVIASQFVAVEFAQRNFQRALSEIEYGKVGGESNYRLLQEIQRDRTSNYLKDLEEKEPDYIRGIKKKIENPTSTTSTRIDGKLLKEEVAAFRSTLPS
jgi:hypothetical protein